MKILFLAHNIFGIGGTVRTVINLAEALSKDHSVEIASVYRRVDEPKLPISPRIRVTGILDTRGHEPGNHRNDPRRLEPSSKVPPSEEFYNQYSRLSDDLVEQFLKRARADVIIGTRPSLNLLVAQFAPQNAIRIAQEHMSHLAIPEGTRDAMRTWYSRMDAAITVTEADARRFRENTPVPGLTVGAIPNSVPAPLVAPASNTSKIIIAGGRLDPVKRFDVLLHAFRRVHDVDPSWSLRIYGAGGEVRALQRLIRELGLMGHAFLMGSSSSLESEWVKGSIAVSSSARESFGMTLVEAMRAGLPVVSTDCPDGPREIIVNGKTGLLVPVDDPVTMADSILSLTTSFERRREMGLAALEESRKFDPAAIGEAYENLFGTLAMQRGSTGKTAGSASDAAVFGALSSHLRHLGSRFDAPTVIGKFTASTRRKFLVAANHPLIPWGKKTRQQVLRRVADCVLIDRQTVKVSLSGISSGWRETWLICHSSRKNQPPVRLRMTEDPLNLGTYSVDIRSHQVSIEGSWGLVAEQGALRYHLVPRTIDVRVLTEHRDISTSKRIVQVTPFAGSDGLLSLRCWSRSYHSEISEISLSESLLTIKAESNIRIDQDSASVRLLMRRSKQNSLNVPIRNISAFSFEFDVSIDDLVRKRISRHDDWDVHLMVGDKAVRIARILDDIPARKAIDIYPHVSVVPFEDSVAWDSPNRQIDVRPYFSHRNELSVSVVER